MNMNNEQDTSTVQVSYDFTCNCVGQQRGQPLCPCRMRGVTIVNGRYVKITDLGAAPESEQLAKRFEAGGPLLGQDPLIGN